MEPATFTVCFGIINITAALAVKVGRLIAELQNAGDDFEEVIEKFKITNSMLLQIETLFRDPSAPPSLVSEYRSHFEAHQGYLDDIEKSIRKIQENLKKSFIKRVSQKQDLAAGDLQRLTDKILFLNTNLSFTVSTYNGRMLGFACKDRMLGSVYNDRRTVVNDVKLDISFQYAGAAMKMQQDDWNSSRLNRRSWTSSSPNLRRNYGGIQPAARTNTGVDREVQWFSPIPKPPAAPAPPPPPPPPIPPRPSQLLPRPSQLLPRPLQLLRPSWSPTTTITEHNDEEIRFSPVQPTGISVGTKKYYSNLQPQPEALPPIRETNNKPITSIDTNGGYSLNQNQPSFPSGLAKNSQNDDFWWTVAERNDSRIGRTQSQEWMGWESRRR